MGCYINRALADYLRCAGGLPQVKGDQKEVLSEWVDPMDRETYRLVYEGPNYRPVIQRKVFLSGKHYWSGGNYVGPALTLAVHLINRYEKPTSPPSPDPFDLPSEFKPIPGLKEYLDKFREELLAELYPCVR